MVSLQVQTMKHILNLQTLGKTVVVPAFHLTADRWSGHHIIPADVGFLAEGCEYLNFLPSVKDAQFEGEPWVYVFI